MKSEHLKLIYTLVNIKVNEDNFLSNQINQCYEHVLGGNFFEVNRKKSFLFSINIKIK